MGEGSHALEHIDTGAAHDFALVAVTGTSEKTVEMLRRATGKAVTCYGSPKELLANPAVDAVLFSSAGGLSLEHLYEVVGAGKPALCEMPLAKGVEDLATLQRILLLASVENVPLMSCHPRREPRSRVGGYAYEWTKRSLSHYAAMYGRVIHVQLDFSDQKSGTVRKNQRNLLQDHFPHQLDFLMWLFENPRIEATRLVDSPAHFSVGGVLNELTTFGCMGTHLETKSTRVETISIRFAEAYMVINALRGTITITPFSDGQVLNLSIEPTNRDIQFGTLMGKFRKTIGARSYDPGLGSHLLRVTTATVELTSPTGETPMNPA